MKSAKTSRKSAAPAAAKANKPTTPDAYLAAVRADQWAALETLRQTIRAAAPEAEEYLSCQLPAFRLHGKFLLAMVPPGTIVLSTPGLWWRPSGTNSKVSRPARGPFVFNRTNLAARPGAETRKTPAGEPPRLIRANLSPL